MNKKTLTVIIVAVAVLIVVGAAYKMFGRPRQYQINAPGGSVTVGDLSAEGTPSQKFMQFSEVSLPSNQQTIKDLDGSIRSVLKAAFGDVKVSTYLTGYMGEGGASATYMTRDNITTDASNKLSTTMESAGFKILSSAGGENSNILAEKDNKMYSIGFTAGTQEVIVVMSPKS